MNVIIFPTDTVYGMGTSYKNKEGIKRIYEIKGRDFNKPLAILISDLDQIKEDAYIHESAYKLASKFWPGGLTMILKSKEAYALESGEKTIAVRVPNHPTALELIQMYGPLKTTSVNYSNEAPMNDYDSIVKVFGNQVDKVYVNHEKISTVSSTVVDLTQEEPIIIRLGEITLDDIQQVLRK